MPPDGSLCLTPAPFEMDGNAGTWEQSIARQVQLFGQLENAGVPNAVIPFAAGGRQWNVKEPEARERLWLIEIFTRETYRQGEGPFFPLTVPQILSGNGGVQNVSQRGIVQLQVDLFRYSGGGQFSMDGGQQIEVWATGVSAQLLVPTGTLEVFPNGGQTFIGQGFTVFDSLFSVAITPIEQTRSKTECQFTVWAHVPQATQPLFEIPAGARRAQIRQTGGAGGPAGDWTLELTGTLGTSPGFVVPFVGRQTEIIGLGYATHLRPDLDPARARDFEIVYFMEP